MSYPQAGKALAFALHFESCTVNGFKASGAPLRGSVQNDTGNPLNVFRALVKRICAHDAVHRHFPDYAVTIDDDMVKFRNRSAVLLAAAVEDDERPYSRKNGHFCEDARPLPKLSKVITMVMT